MRNSHLEGQVEAVGATASQRRPPTYAERVGLRSKTALASNLKRDPPSVVTIVPKDLKAFTSSDATKRTVQSLIFPARDGLQVFNLRTIQGNGILVETANKSDATELLGNEKLRAAGLLVGAPQKKNPHVIIYNTPRTLDDEAFLATIIEKNVKQDQSARMRQQMRVAFRSGDGVRDHCNVILEVSKDVRDFLLKKEALYIVYIYTSIHSIHLGHTLLQVSNRWTYGQIL